MIIGTLRPEDARVFNSEEGYHSFHNEEGESYGAFEVFWHHGGHMVDPDEDDDMPLDDWREAEKAGWYWHACFPGCIPDGDPSGPFASSREARADADWNWEA